MIFDQYQRYKTVQIVIDLVRTYLQKEKLSILEIGANGNLEIVLPEDDIQYSDAILSEEMRENKKFIQLDGCHMPEVTDGKYDIVIALDVFEHITEEQRENFLKEVKRVAKYMAIICFPYKSSYNENAEKRVNSYYKMLYRCDHQWLAEHIQNGLPRIEQVIQMLEENKIPYQEFYHGDIFLWEEMMKALFTVYGLQSGGGYYEELDRLYAEQMYFNDRSKYSYRVFMFMSDDIEILQEIRNNLNEKYAGNQSEEAREILFRCIDDIKYQLINEQGRKISIQHQLYYSFDGSFCESQKWVHSSESLNANIVHVYWKIEIDKKYNALRFDPVEEENCIVKNLLIESNVGELGYKILNGIYDQDRIIFCEEDPQIYIKLQDKPEIDWICICADIIRTGFPEAIIRYPIGRKIDFLGESLRESVDKSENNISNIYSLLSEYIQRQNEINNNLDKYNELLGEKTRRCEELQVQLQTLAERERDVRIEKEDWREQSKQWEERSRQYEEQSKRWEERSCQYEEQSKQWEERCAKMESTVSWRITSILRILGKLFQRKEG